MISINPYLNFNGKTEEAFKFYKSVFGGEFSGLQRFKETPEGAKMPKSVQNKIMYITLPIGVNNALMATDSLESMGQKLVVGNNFYLSLGVDNAEETRRIFLALSKGGTVDMPMGKVFWGAYFGMLTDKFGIQWMISYDPKVDI